MKGPIFIVGTMRSGSTLLRLILDSHENIAIGPESGFVRAVAPLRTLPPWPSGPGWYRRLGLTDEEMDARIAAFFNDLFHHYAASQGKARWGDKTPHNLFHMRFLADAFPDAAFLGIVRHPGAVASSLARRGKRFPDAVHSWTDRNAEMVRRGEELGERFRLVRYEDLVQAPEAVLRPVVAFLDEPWSDSLLAHHRIHADRGAPRITDGGTRTQQPLDPTRALAWLEDAGGRDLEVVAAVAAPLLPLFGYTATGVQSLDDPPLLDGHQLAERRGRLATALPPLQRRRTGTSTRRRVATVRRVGALVRTDPAYALRRSVQLGRGVLESRRTAP